MHGTDFQTYTERMSDPTLLEEGLAATRAPRVVLAEDDDDARALLATALRGEGCDVVEARDGAELVMETTIASGEHAPADIILSDVRMPRLSGLQALRQLRRANCHAPTILMTAYRDPDVHAEAARLGAETVFDKPFDVRDVVAAVLASLSWRAWQRRARWTAYAERHFGLGGDGTPG